MNEHEQNKLLWDSCFLGFRTACQSHNISLTLENFKKWRALVEEVARNETTLTEPNYNHLIGLDPETQRSVLGSANKSIIAAKDLALRVLAGFAQATPTEDGSEEPLPRYADSLPLRVDPGGIVRVGNSRVSLDVVVEQYENGMTPEEMVRAYDTLVLADIYAVIAYYLRHRDEVRAYLKRREEEAEVLRAKIEAKHPHIGRDELLARRRAREKDHAPTGQ